MQVFNSTLSFAGDEMCDVLGPNP